MKKHCVAAIVLFFLLVGYRPLVKAQYLFSPVSNLLNAEAWVLTTDGKEVTGKVSAATLGMKGLSSITIKDSGNKHKFSAEEVAMVRTSVTKIAKAEMMLDNTSSLSRLANADFEATSKRDSIYFEQVEWPNKPGKFLLSQQLNPSFGSKIKIFDYPSKKTGTTSFGGIPVSGGNAKSFIVKKDGKVMLIDRKNYEKEHFGTLFSDCPALEESLEKNEKQFKMFAGHVFFYETSCD